MITLMAALLLLVLVVVGLYVFGLLNTPYLEAFRFAFYVLLVIFVLTVAVGLMDHPQQGYDPTARTP